MKFKSKDRRFLDFFQDDNLMERKFKDAKSLTKILKITDAVLSEIDPREDENFRKFNQMKKVLESGGHFDGLTRKLQIKVENKENDPDDPTKFKVT